MKSKIFYSLLIILLGLIFITDIEAQRKFDDDDDFPPPPPYLIEKLKLTEAQKNKLDDLRYNYQKEMIALRSELWQKLLEMKKYRSSENISRSKVIALTKEINEIRNKIALARANHQMDLYELLDDTQRKIWHENRPLGFGDFERGKRFFRKWKNLCW